MHLYTGSDCDDKKKKKKKQEEMKVEEFGVQGNFQEILLLL